MRQQRQSSQRSSPASDIYWEGNYLQHLKFVLKIIFFVKEMSLLNKYRFVKPRPAHPRLDMASLLLRMLTNARNARRGFLEPVLPGEQPLLD